MRFTCGIPLLLALACGTNVDERNSTDDSTPTNSNESADAASRSETQSNTASSQQAGSHTKPNAGVSEGPTHAEYDASASNAPQGTSSLDESDSESTGAESTGGESSGTPVLPSEVPLELEQALQDVSGLSAAAFLERSAVPFEELGYEPTGALGLDLIQSSDLGLNDAELAKYAENGFVISPRVAFPHFGYGYASVYAQDLPLFISADSILYALHTSYDAILKNLEMGLLIPATGRMLASMRANLAVVAEPSAVRDDIDLYLTVAESLLFDELRAPTLEHNADAVSQFFDACKAAGAAATVQLFGSEREFDFSQFKPRGHYTDTLELQRYFRAMIWMGRVEFRLVKSEAGEPRLNRRETEAAITLRSLMNDEAKQSHQRVDAVVSAFVGEHDAMTPSQVDALVGDLGLSSPAELQTVSDETLLAALLAGNYGVQRITSQIMVGGLGDRTTPLPAAFALFGQRYVIDSHVFSNVVYDRVKAGAVRRMMPNPLDVAYAALQNDHAGLLLQADLERYDYASDLASMRAIVDSEPREFWELSLYNRWLDALRTLSPDRAMKLETGENLPQIARTEAWGRRLLNTQLASWAELRHDTILYVKQSYTSAATCEYPDAYVDPYPEFFGAIATLAEHALAVLAELGFDPDAEVESTVPLSEQLGVLALRKSGTVLTKFVEVGRILEQMAVHQRTGEPHSEEHLAFVNEAVQTQGIGCGGPPGQTGWYSQLFLDPELTWDPTIADVHTQPTDEGGASVGRVLHVGTGESQLMVVSVETCSGPRAYVGVVSSYYERIENDWRRLDDVDWQKILAEEVPAPPSWVASLMAQ